jgi:hypothetical protein
MRVVGRKTRPVGEGRGEGGLFPTFLPGFMGERALGTVRPHSVFLSLAKTIFPIKNVRHRKKFDLHGELR